MNFLKPGPLSTSKRLNRALAFGIPIGIVIGVIHYFVREMLGGFELSLIYILVGYAVGQAIQYVSHGVGIKFRYITVGVYIIAMLVTDVVMPSLLWGISPLAYLVPYLQSMLNAGGLLSVAFRIAGGVAAYFSLG